MTTFGTKLNTATMRENWRPRSAAVAATSHLTVRSIEVVTTCSNSTSTSKGSSSLVTDNVVVEFAFLVRLD